MTNTVLDTAEINAEFNRDFAGAGFDDFARARFHNFAGAGFNNFARAGFDDFARAGFNNFAGAGFHNFAGAGFHNFARAGFHNFARARFDRAGGFRFVTASGFNPPPLIRSPIADVLRNTTFTNASRIHGVAHAISHFIKTRVVAVLVVIAIAVHKLDALGNDNFAGARCRSNTGTGFDDFARAGFDNFARAGYHDFARAGCRFFGTGRNNFAGARYRCNTGTGYFNRARRCRGINAFRFNPPPCLGCKIINPLRIFRLAIRVHGIALAFYHIMKAGIIAMFAIMTSSILERNASGAVLSKSHRRGYAQEQ